MKKILLGLSTMTFILSPNLFVIGCANDVNQKEENECQDIAKMNLKTNLGKFNKQPNFENILESFRKENIEITIPENNDLEVLNIKTSTAIIKVKENSKRFKGMIQVEFIINISF